MQPQAIKSRLVMARKTHKCCECSAPIVKGMYYQYTSGIWASSPYSFKQCGECAILFQKVTDFAVSEDPAELEELPSFGDLNQYLADKASDYGMELESGEFMDEFSKDCSLDPIFLECFFWRLAEYSKDKSTRGDCYIPTRI